MDFRENDAFLINVYSANGEKLSPEGLIDGLSDASDDPPGFILFAVTSMVSVFDDQPIQSQAKPSSAGAVIRSVKSTQRMLTMACITWFFGFAVVALIVVVFAREFSWDFIKSDWPIIPVGAFLSFVSWWVGSHLFIRVKKPPSVTVPSDSGERPWSFVSHSEWLSRPRVCRRDFVPAFVFISRIGVARDRHTTVKAAAESRGAGLKGLDYVTGLCAADGQWLSLLKTSSLEECRDHITRLATDAPGLADIPIVDMSDTSRFVWACDTPEDSGTVQWKTQWATKR